MLVWERVLRQNSSGAITSLAPYTDQSNIAAIVNHSLSSIFCAAVLSLILCGAISCGPPSPETSTAVVEVTRGTVIRTAVAVGHIRVEHEVPVKSLTGGILTELFVELGQKIEKAAPLAEVRPVITDRDFLNMERALQAAKDGEESANEYLAGNHAAAWFTRLMTGRKNLERMSRQAELTRQRSEEQLQLLHEGKTIVGARALDYIVRAPVSGYVLDIVTRVGAPVVPSSSYGSGVVLMVLADLDAMLFIGTVDEMDVGRLKQGMQGQIRIGALSAKTIRGEVSEIGLKSQIRNNATVFEVRLKLEAPADMTLRSGYSAIAEIETARRENILVLPERVVRFQSDGAYVTKSDASGRPVEQQIETGLSDGLTLEIVNGLSAGDKIFECK
jgi:HlyD family secretion protein